MPRNPTPAQSNTSRRNGSKSPGPKTPEGKAAVRINALKHGLAAETIILPGEHMPGFDKLHEDLIQRIQPADDVELEFVHDLAQTRWRLQRCVLLERNTIFYRMQLMEPEVDRQWENPDMVLRSAAAHSFELAKGAVKNLSIYEGRIRRALRGIQKDLIEFRKAFPLPQAPALSPSAEPEKQKRTNKPEPALTLVESNTPEPSGSPVQAAVHPRSAPYYRFQPEPAPQTAPEAPEIVPETTPQEVLTMRSAA